MSSIGDNRPVPRRIDGFDGDFDDFGEDFDCFREGFDDFGEDFDCFGEANFASGK